MLQLEGLVKEVDVGEDWRVDPVLREACKPVVDVACQEVRGGDARYVTSRRILISNLNPIINVVILPG